MKGAASKNRKKRRDFLRTLIYGVGVIGAAVAGLIPVLGGRTRRVRPPGALADQQFMAACIKCGQCVQVCPVNAIKLAELDDGFGIGTPYIRPTDCLSSMMFAVSGAAFTSVGEFSASSAMRSTGSAAMK